VTLRQRIIACTRCPRLIEHCKTIAVEKKRAHRDKTYWGRPVPSFGPQDPRLLVVGLAPGAHGANRTGRVFCGDASGVWLYRALHEHGFATRAETTSRRDGLKLVDAVIANVVRCAPPGNKPTAAEQDACRPFFVEEIASYGRLEVVLALGKIGFDGVRKAFAELGRGPVENRFGHGAEQQSGGVTILCSYHPSQQNTHTGRLTWPMFSKVFHRARRILDGK